jgi:hypothetical protein
MSENPEYLWSLVEHACHELDEKLSPYMSLVVKDGRLEWNTSGFYLMDATYIATVTHRNLAIGFSDERKMYIIARLRKAVQDGQLSLSTDPQTPQTRKARHEPN